MLTRIFLHMTGVTYKSLRSDEGLRLPSIDDWLLGCLEDRIRFPGCNEGGGRLILGSGESSRVHLPLLVWPPFPRNWRRWRLLFVPWYRRHIRIKRSLGSIWYHVRAFRLRISSPFHVVSTFKLTCLSDIFIQVICMSDTRVGKRLAFNDEDEKRV